MALEHHVPVNVWEVLGCKQLQVKQKLRVDGPKYEPMHKCLLAALLCMCCEHDAYADGLD